MNYLKSIIHTLFYGNVFIAFTAICMTWMTSWVFNGDLFKLNSYHLFVFFGTWTLYNLHRYIGIRKVNCASAPDRFMFLADNRRWVMAMIIGSVLASIYYGFSYLLTIGHILIWPMIISFFYAVPLFNKRLRDISYIKIILIAISWSWLTVLIPAILLNRLDIDTVFMIIERTLFVFAITIPFDIRDMQQDQSDRLKTLVNSLGIPKSKLMGYIALITAALISIYLFSTGLYSLIILFSFISTFSIASVLIYLTTPKRHELYFVGLLDGLMALPFILVYLIQLLCGN